MNDLRDRITEVIVDTAQETFNSNLADEILSLPSGLIAVKESRHEGDTGYERDMSIKEALEWAKDVANRFPRPHTEVLNAVPSISDICILPDGERVRVKK